MNKKGEVPWWWLLMLIMSMATLGAVLLMIKWESSKLTEFLTWLG